MSTRKIRCNVRILVKETNVNIDLGTALVPIDYDSNFMQLVNELKKRISTKYGDKYANLIYSHKTNNPTIYVDCKSNIESNIDTENNKNNMNKLPEIMDWNDQINDLYNANSDTILFKFQLFDISTDTINEYDDDNKTGTVMKPFENKPMQDWTSNDIIAWINSLHSISNTFKNHLIIGMNMLNCDGWDILNCKNEYELSEALNVAIVIGRRLYRCIQSYLNNPRYNFTSLKNLDPVSFAIVQSINNSYLIKKYNISQYIVHIIYFYLYESDMTLWLDASDEKTLTLDKDNYVLKWKSKSLNNIVLTCQNRNKYVRPSPASHHAQNANNWSMPMLLNKDDIKNKYINGIQYSYQQTHMLSNTIKVGTILAVYKYKRINKSCTFYIFGHNTQCIDALHGSNDGVNRRSGVYILGNGNNEFYLNNKKLDPSGTKYWEDVYKIATLKLKNIVSVNRIGAERRYHAFEGVIAECIVYPRKIEEFERCIIEDYFQNKYKLNR
eukprot:175753_1